MCLHIDGIERARAPDMVAEIAACLEVLNPSAEDIFETE
jgi:hypothetical protein